jgi:phospholipid-binding lipoprotein MlaA
VHWGLVTLRLIQTRADLLDASRILEEAALDRYVFQRDAYLQRRRSLVYDGRPPREKEPDDDNDKKSN